MCNDRNAFISYKRLASPTSIKLGDETTVIATHHGLVDILQKSTTLHLKTLYTLTFRLSLLSINQLDRSDDSTTFRRGVCSVSMDSITLTANRVGDLYFLQSHADALNFETGVS